MYEKLQILCKEKGITITNLCKEVTGSTGNLSTWKKGYMRSDYIAKVSEILGCSIDYLLGRNDSSEITVSDNDDVIQKQPDNITAEFVQLFQSLDIADKIAVMNLALEKSKK